MQEGIELVRAAMHVPNKDDTTRLKLRLRQLQMYDVRQWIACETESVADLSGKHVPQGRGPGTCRRLLFAAFDDYGLPRSCTTQ